MNGSPLRIAIVGGSIGGLTAALVLRELGHEVDVFERMPEVLDSRGAGIVLQPDTMRWFERGSERSVPDISTSASCIRYVGEDNTIVHEEPARWRFASWSAIYRPLIRDFGLDRYHLGEHFAGFDQDEHGVTLRFTSGREQRADLAVFSDGISSTARRLLLPSVAPNYAGYVGWRGTVVEREVSQETSDVLHDALGYAVIENSHINLYPIPGPAGELGRGDRQLNYVWYRNVPEGPLLEELLTDRRGSRASVSIQPGQVQQRYVDQLRQEAGELLPPAPAELVRATAQPFLQVVVDIEVPRMTFGRVCLIGDAAFAARPHAAAGTAKAAKDAWALGDALATHEGDVIAALEAWEPDQLEIGRNLVDRSRGMGDRSQFEGTWTPGDPSLLFGLYGPGR